MVANKNIFLSFCMFVWIEKKMQIFILSQTKILSIKLLCQLFIVEFFTLLATLPLILGLAEDSNFPPKLEI